MYGSARGQGTKWSHQQYSSTINLSSYSLVCKINRAICNWLNPYKQAKRRGHAVSSPAKAAALSMFTCTSPLYPTDLLLSSWSVFGYVTGKMRFKSLHLKMTWTNLIFNRQNRWQKQLLLSCSLSVAMGHHRKDEVKMKHLSFYTFQ